MQQNVYKNQCNTIRQSQFNNCNAFKEMIPTFTPDQINKLERILTQEFESHKQSFLNKKQHILDSLQAKCLYKKRWQECIQLIDAVDEFNESNKNLPLSGVDHDESLVCLAKIKEKLGERSINPDRIDIVTVKNVNYIYQAITVIPTLCLIEVEGQDFVVALNLDDVIHGKINVNGEKISQLPGPARAAFLLRMAEDILWNHSAAPYIVEKMAPMLTDDSVGFLNSKEFADLKDFYLYHRSVFLPCLRDTKNIANMLRAIFEYPEKPTALEDYRALSEIKNCVEKLKAIQAFKEKDSV